MSKWIRQFHRWTSAVFVLTVVAKDLMPLLVGRDTQLPGDGGVVARLGGVGSLGLTGILVGPMGAALFVAPWKVFASVETPARAG